MYVPLSAFRNFTRFAINPDRIGVIESGYYTGCVEVHLANYRYQEATLPGGIGLTLAGKHDSMRERASGQLALIAGFNEVFKIACTYDGCVVLRPLGIGIGHRSQLASRYSNMRSRKRRIQKKHAKKAAQFTAWNVQTIAALTGTLVGKERRPEGPYYLLERTDKWQRATPIQATTLHQARQVARARVAQLQKNGWNCAEEDCRRGELGRTTESTVAWICKKHGPNKWVSVECGDLPKPKEDKWAMEIGKGDGRTMTAAEITDACKTWAMFNGFSGEHCYHCLTDQNVLAGGPGFICPTCGHHNVMGWHDHQMPHEHPEYGPTRAVIHAGVVRYRKDIGELREDGTEVPFCEQVKARKKG